MLIRRRTRRQARDDATNHGRSKPTYAVSPHAIILALLLMGAVAITGCPSYRIAPERTNAALPRGSIELTILDASTGKRLPARVEVRGAEGTYHVATDALRVGGDCDMSDEGAGYTDLASTLAGFSDRIDNPYSGSIQFYSTGTSSLSLPVGTATVRVFRGPEYRVAEATVDVVPSSTLAHTIELTRWSDLPDRGWYSADDHLHVPRPSAELNPAISAMMQAEDLHVANLLQMGKVENFAIAPQHAHGPAGHYQQGNFILAAGQENPRTHFLGHTITLGASQARHHLDAYLVFRLLWEQTAAEGALNGFAHAGAPNGSPISPWEGIAVVAPHDLMHFMEVLQFNRSGYEAWYELLTLGFRVTPTAGTDFPCGDQTIPGHERFYTKVDGALTYASWLDGVRLGRTFVTTGPMIEFAVENEEIGGEIRLSEESAVRVTGRATFDPTRDDLAFLELVRNGDVVARYSRVGGANEIAFETSLHIEESSWLALRGYGTRLENAYASPGHFSSFEPTSNVHTAPIYVTLEGRPPIGAGPKAEGIAQAWLARLEDLERVLAEENLDFLSRRLASPIYDGVPRDTLLRDREALLEEIRTSKTFFRGRAQ